jgi:TolB-like protein/Tfp pilus assembly protein PilF
MSAPSGSLSAGDRLDSWKEIAAYLGREVRTVQGWEKTEALPVHRHQHARQGSVYAFKSELDAWREVRRGTPEAPPLAAVEDPAPPAPRKRPGGRAIAAGLCAIVVLGLVTVLWTKVRSKQEAGVPTSVAVLPFLDLSPQKDQEYFSDGLAEEIIDALTRVPNLRVVARTSAFAFKGKAVDIREIGRQLNVGAVLEGSVRKSGDQLRITAQLARVADGYHFWSRTYDRPLRDVFAVQREISESIAGQLRAGEAPRREQVHDMEAYRLFQEGRYFFNKFEPPESNRKAIERYRRAIARDPTYAQAYAGLADAYSYLAETFAAAPKEIMPKAREAAEKAVALDDSSSEAHTSLGIIKLDYDRDVDGAQREFVRAIQLTPGSGYAHHWYAHSLEAQNRLDEAMKEMRAALALDPLSLPINWDVASELLCARQPDAALQQLHKAGELFPGNPILAFLQLEAYHQKGDRESARRVLASLKAGPAEIDKDPMLLAMFGVQAAIDGRAGESRRFLEKMERLRKTQYVDAFMALPVVSALHDNRQLLLWLRRADEERSTMFVYLPIMKDLYGLDAGTLAQAGK